MPKRRHPADSDASRTTVTVRRSGGFTGLTREASAPLASLDVGVLPLVETLLGRGAASGAAHGAPGSAAAGPQRDVAMIDLTIEDGQRRWQTSFIETETPAELVPLLETVRQRGQVTKPRR